ncbi:unnamed protein product, partial [Prorocentrum cordatum]
ALARASPCGSVAPAMKLWGTRSGWRKTSRVGDAEACEEEWEDDVVPDAPAYWSNRPRRSNSMAKYHYDQMVYVSKDKHAVLDEMLANTYHPKVTQDRPCPSGQHGRVRGGCPCVQPGALPGLPISYRVKRVIRVEDSKMWQRYPQRETIRAGRDGETLPEFDPPVSSDAVARQHGNVFHDLDKAGLNEVYLWHGTSVRAALNIAQDDFNMDFAGSSRGTMYGPGVYLAESCTKADEYARDEPGGYYEGVFAMLLCRVCMGKFNYTLERDETAGEKCLTGEYDSTLGDRLKSVGTFREFVVYNSDQLYPEYIIMYERVLSSDLPADVEERANTAFHTQLPAYWSSCHLNPLTTQFNLHVYVRFRTLRLLQKLVARTVDGRPPRVVKARRVENSVVWNSYVSYKRKLADRLTTLSTPDTPTPSFTEACELDGDRSAGGVHTDLLLQELHSEDCVSFDNIESRLNEHMLWHVTDRAGAEEIVKNDFKIEGGNWFRFKREHPRFGKGAYFAEHLDLEQASEEDGIRYVLFCRVACGDYYYTEQDTETDAHKSCRAAGKDSILANPCGQGPRQFVVLGNEGVYPEFVLELNCNEEPDPRTLEESDDDVAEVAEVEAPACELLQQCSIS